ncbi:hypothetical protein [Dictyobacter kobayashii]|uniref:Uncharacterized protein n=1 Tax=Dictyobacter kobayashii TaxID=2014872 RepID=A0A402AS18_9CHLR|nr:hypothetical protein [Dictyobacter kobayashii]GCE21886.1 hypothetical protein KDK_56860 [Dictyobacter kobayashii]
MRRLYHTDQDCPTYLLEYMLAAIGTPAARAAMAEYATSTHRQKNFMDLGFWLPADGKIAEARFTQHRSALRFQPVADTLTPEELIKLPHPVGLPISLVAEEKAQTMISWHYLTLDLTQVAGLPTLAFSRAHLVSPLHTGSWTLFCTISEQNLYTQAKLSTSEDEDPEQLALLRAQTINYQDAGKGELRLLPYDDQLVYRNGHTQSTAHVYGDVGGPPLGLSENPSCPICGKLMFHLCTIASTLREYGAGFRSAFLCEDCQQVASQSSGWN